MTDFRRSSANQRGSLIRPLVFEPLDLGAGFGGQAGVGTTHTKPYALSFTNASDVMIPGIDHKLKTQDLEVVLYTNDVPPRRVTIGWTVDASTFDVTLDHFAVPMSGRAIVFPLI